MKNIAIIKKNTLEIFIIIFVFFILWILLAAKIKVAPNSSDILYYFEIGNKHIADPLILNRYIHVYLQQFFVSLAGSALQGLQIYWAFLFSGTLALIYASSRFFSVKSTPYHGILSVLLFLSLPAITEIAGTPFIDVTAMFFTVAFTFTFLMSSKNKHDNKLLLVTLGLLFFCSFKTKETTLPLAILFIPLSFSDNKINLQILFQRLLLVVIGISIGITLLILINAVYLKEPFFGLRLSDLKYYMNTNMADKGFVVSGLTREDWLVGYFFRYAFLPTILYIISGTINILKLEIDQRFVFIIPLALIFFLVISINNIYGFQTRFALPTLAVICITASQFITIDTSRFSLTHKRFLLTLSGSILFSIAMVMLIRHIELRKGVDLALFFTTFLNAVLIIILISIIFLDKNTAFGSIACISIIMALLLLPLDITYKNIFINQANRSKFEETIAPIVEYRDVLGLTNNSHLLIDKTAVDSGPIAMAKNIDEVIGLINLCYDSKLERTNVRLVDDTSNIKSDLIMAPKYDYLLLSSKTWSEISIDTELYIHLNENYLVINGIETNTVLLYAR